MTLDFGFAHPGLLWALALLPVLWLLRRWALRRRRAALTRWAGPAGRGVPLVAAGSLLVVTLSVLAAAGPTWGRAPRQTQAEGRDLLVLLDVSRSMLAEDEPPRSRLLRAKRQLAALLAQFEKEGRTERVGLVAFAGRARTLSPFTTDYDHLREALRRAGPESFTRDERLAPTAPGEPARGTSFAAALAEALRLWKLEPTATCDFLLLSDGAGGEPITPELLAPLRAAGMPLHVLGLGDPKVAWPIPTDRPEEPFLMTEEPTTQQRTRLLTLRDDVTLTKLASGGGRFVPEAEGALVAWWTDAIRPLPGRRTAGESRLAPIPRFAWLVGLLLMGLGLSLLRPLWPRRARRAAPALAATLVLILLSGAAPPAAFISAQAAYERGDWAAALVGYDAALPASADPGQVAFNQAACLSKLERWDEAAGAYRRSLEDAAGLRAGLAWYGRGNCLAHLGVARQGPAGARLLEQALLAYGEAEPALRAEPLGAAWLLALRENRAQVEAALAAKRREPPPPGEATPPPADLRSEPEGDGEPERGTSQPRTGAARPAVDPLTGEAPTATDQQRPGAGSLPLVPDGGTAPPLPPEEARRVLQATLERLRQVRKLQSQGDAVLPPTKRDW